VTPARLESCYFTPPDNVQWPRLARVLLHTARRHCPGWDVRIRPMAPARLRAYPRASLAFIDNVRKVIDWTETIAAASIGDRILLIDTDTFLVRPLDPVWDFDFDLAYTARLPTIAMPLNAGVIVVRVSAVTQAFMRAWRDENIRMLADPAYHETWMRRFGGINQAALGSLFRQAHGVRLLALPCAEWNCEDTSWDHFDPAHTRIVHVKSALRLAVFNLVGASPVTRPLVKVWRQLEADAMSLTTLA
jgi:hypothetical protein